MGKLKILENRLELRKICKNNGKCTEKLQEQLYKTEGSSKIWEDCGMLMKILWNILKHSVKNWKTEKNAAKVSEKL